MFRLDRSSPIPLFHQIAQEVRWAISKGDLAPGDQLLTSRKGAESWGVNRHTVRRAYRELQAAGLVQVEAGRTVVAPHSRVAPSLSPETMAFVDELVEDARRRYGLTPSDLTSLLAARDDTRSGAGSAEVTIVECNPVQCEDLGSQISARWNVQASPFVLDSDTGEPGPGPIVATLFHVDEVRRRWPRLAERTLFVAIVPDPAITRIVDHLRKSFSVRHPVLLADRHGRNIAADLSPLLPGDGSPEVIDWTPQLSAELLEALRNRIVLVSQRVWSRLDSKERQSLNLVEVRYLVPKHELDHLGRALSWEERHVAPR